MKIPYLILWIVPIFGFPVEHIKKQECGYNSCPTLNASDLNVHIIAHSHDDVGWLKTVDEYYYGSRSTIQAARVKYIITSVIDALLKNPERRFIQVETAFFHKWWQEQDEEKRQQVHALLENGQLQIVGGGWSMNDESAAHYQSIIDQFTFGLKFLKNTFGECAIPKIGWQIDPFGHTREMASIFAQMGYDALFFARLDWRDKTNRLATRTGEMLWRSSANLGNESLLFTHVLYEHYSPPPGFYFDVYSNDDPLISDKSSPTYNLEWKVKSFATYVNGQASSYSSNNIVVTMGNDFSYQDAHYNYDNLDILIKAFQDSKQVDYRNRTIRLLYSTPDCYLKAVNDYAKSHNLTYKIKTDDFIPLGNDPHTYWSGYYTSRPTQKRFERQGNNLLQITKQLTAQSSIYVDKQVDELRAAMGIMQHHDAITGTEKQAVAKDYARIMMKAFDSTFSIIDLMLKQFLAKNESEVFFTPCLLANVSYCPQSQKEKFVIAVYNPLSRIVSHHVRLPVNSDSFNISDLNGNNIKWQITPRIGNFSNRHKYNISRFDLVFLAEDLPPLGAKLFYVVNKKFGQKVDDIVPAPFWESFDLGDNTNGIKLNRESGFLKNVILNGVSLNVKQEMLYYLGAQGNNEIFANRSSGAYIFRPDPKNGTALPITDNLVSSMETFKGELVDEVHQTFNNWMKQVIRVYKNNNKYIEFDWLVGPIDVHDQKGKEVISRFQIGDFSPNGTIFFTDSNGRELIKRKRDYRETFNYTNEEAVAGNYYPITSSISLVDERINIEASVLTDRSQGGTSLASGEMELMLHRRLLHDDAFGVGEALNEEEFGMGLKVRGQHFFTFGAVNDYSFIPRASTVRREIAQEKILAPWVFLADVSALNFSLTTLQEQLHSEFSLLIRELPSQVQLLTLEYWRENEILLRFEHILEISEGGVEEIIDLDNLFTLFDVTDIYETTLAGNIKANEHKPMNWTGSGCLSNLHNCSSYQFTEDYSGKIEGTEIPLRPMQIRTFIATIQGK